MTQPNPQSLKNSESGILCLSLTPCLQRTLTFSNLAIGEVNRTANIKVTASGKAVNTARIIQLLGSTAWQLGFLGGSQGTEVRSRLVEENLQHHYVETESQTRICQTLIDESAGLVTELVEEMVNPSESEWTQLKYWLEENCDRFNDFIFAGSPPPGAGPRIYSDLIQLIRKRHPIARFWVDSQKAPMLHALEQNIFLAKLNRQEYEATIGIQFGSTRSAADHARGWLDDSEWVMMTAGTEGVWLMGKENNYLATPPKVQAVNPIGSGDSVTAGLLVGFLQKLPVEKALQLAVACGAANAMSSTSGSLNPDDLASLRDRVRVDSFC